MGQIRLLTRTFFGRLFESDLMPQGLPQVQLIVWGLVFAGGPTLGLPMLLAKKYTRLYLTGGLPMAIATDRVVLFTLSMLAIGFVGLVIWDGVFPDRRDVRILGSLPVAARTLITARLLALARVFLLFGAAICVPQAVFFGLLAGSYGDPAGLIRGVAAHFVTAAAACIFVFSMLMALQCLLLVLLGRRAAQTASVVLQVVFAIGLVQLLFFLPQIGAVLKNRNQVLDWASNGAALLPGVWFLGLYEWLGGFASRSSVPLAQLAVAVTVISFVLSIVLYAASYGRLSRLALEGLPPKRMREGRQRHRRSVRPESHGRAIRDAVRQFTLRTLVRSRQHRMILALYAGLGLALVLSSLLALALRRNAPPLSLPSISLLSIPLVLQFFPLLGIRMVTAIPAEPTANWAFRAAEPSGRGHAIDGVRDAMIRAVIVPTTALALLEGWLLWGVVAGVCHALFCWTLGTLLIEILLASMLKIPFTCTYLPGRARLRTLWSLYFIAFTTYCYTIAGIELLLLATPLRMVAVCAMLLLAGRIAIFARHRTLADATGLRFAEEDPDALFEGFRLSEGLAATARTPAE